MHPKILRQSLNDFCDEKIKVEELAARHPTCECEMAVSPDHGHGPVKDCEVVRLFLTSTSDINGARSSQLKLRPFKAKSLQKAYTKGLSTYRLKYASATELENSAKLLYDYQIGRNNKFGGVLGVVDFPVYAVRYCPEPHAPMCVFETPLGQNTNGIFDRPSHSDIVNSKADLTDEEQKIHREIVFNLIKQYGKQTNSEDVSDCNLKSLLPNILSDYSE